jgi:hypothetical protein
MPTKPDTAKAIFQAYVAKDRAAIERLLAEDFRFTSHGGLGTYVIGKGTPAL